jgi:ribosomal protein L22
MSAEPPEQREDQPGEDAGVEADVTPHEEPTAEAVEAEAPAGEPEDAAGAGEPTAEAAPARKRRRSLRTAKAKPGEQGSELAAAGEGDTKAEPAAAKARARKRTAPAPAGDEQETATPARPAAAPRPARKPGGRPRRRVVRARARYVRTPARKARIVCVHLPGKSVAQARAILAFTPRAVARDWSKLLESAVANAENNHELLEEDLIVREAYADEGPTIKRFRPRAMGRATPIRKRTSHLTITLTASGEKN